MKKKFVTNLHVIILKRKPIGPNNKINAYKKAHGLENLLTYLLTI